MDISKGILEKVFEKYKEKYEKVFEMLYPAKNSTGFTERNLSVNYSKAMEDLYPSAVTWFEFQFGEKNNQHIDAVIINPELKTIFIIEAKRFNLVARKTKSIGADIVRINSLSANFTKEFAERIPDFADYKLQGMILADVWTEVNRKTEIKLAFENNIFLEKYLPNIAQKYPESKMQYNVIGFENTPYESVNKNYFLLSMTWEMK
jgi:hypothetical protein